MVAENLAETFGGTNAMETNTVDTVNNVLESFEKNLKLVEGVFDNSAVRSAQKILDTVNRSNRIGLGELSPLCRVTGRCAPD